MAINDAREYKPRGGENWGKKIGFWSAVFVALPALGACLLHGVDIWKTPDRVDVLAREQEKMGKDIEAQRALQKDMREGLNRILSAMHLEPIKEPKQKDSP